MFTINSTGILRRKTLHLLIVREDVVIVSKMGLASLVPSAVTRFDLKHATFYSIPTTDNSSHIGNQWRNPDR